MHSPVSRRLSKRLAMTLGASLALIASVSCASSPAAVVVPDPPKIPDVVWAELERQGIVSQLAVDALTILIRELSCDETAEFMVHEVHPYFVGLEAINE